MSLRARASAPSASPPPKPAVPVVGTQSDEELVRRLVSGDLWAREALYRRHFATVWGTALRLLGSRNDVEDVVQDTFLTAFADIAALRDPGALVPWLLRIAINQVHRRHRRQRLLRIFGLERRVEDGSLEHLADESADPLLRLELSQIDRALSDLPFAERAAWTLRRVDGHSLEAAAAACDCSLATVKRRIRAADRKVREHLDVQEQDDV
jgi:RNA polymerase sigma-70 factor, ECF subfamily